MTTQTNVTPYELLGGEAGVRRLVHRFYELMHELPEAHQVRRLHPESLDNSDGANHRPWPRVAGTIPVVTVDLTTLPSPLADLARPLAVRGRGGGPPHQPRRPDQRQALLVVVPA